VTASAEATSFSEIVLFSFLRRRVQARSAQRQEIGSGSAFASFPPKKKHDGQRAIFRNINAWRKGYV
jgi:hypothetical protein